MKPHPVLLDEPDPAAAGGVQHAVERAVADFRRGAFVVIEDAAGAAVVAHAAEAATDRSLAALARLAGRPPTVLLTGRRAAALKLGAGADGVVGLAVANGLDAEALRRLIDPSPAPAYGVPSGMAAVGGGPPAPLVAAAVQLAKLSRLLPAAVAAPLPMADPARFAAAHDLLRVGAAAVDAYPRLAAASLQPVSEARVPLDDALDTRIVAFRPADGGAEQYAIVIGEPAPDAPVLCRLHSACFTGDLLGSLRCDCGPQLRTAIRAMAAAGAGVVLYLDQEGRGIGLVNKLRAYRLQDRGLDTFEANEHLGFEPDERGYLGAATMLRHLGVGRVRLMTNNPDKVGALARYGIEVAERVPIAIPSNEHNRRYLRTKVRRSGHLLEA